MRFRAIADPATRQGAHAEALELREESRLHKVEPASANLTLRGITKHWRRGWRPQPDPVIHDIDLDLAPGELVWIGGSNGVGKTTLLRIIAGVITPDAGTIRLQGLDPERERRRYQSQIGFLTAGNTGLIARLSARYQLNYWAHLAFVPASEREAAIERVLTTFSLHELAAKRVDRLSMGQRQRIRAAMVFLHSPDVVLLDEPLTSLDDDGAALLSGAIREVTARGGSVVSCSPGHDDEAKLDFDRHCVIEAGRLVPA
jgi:ABC-2 type transport system ATP-binding protein